MARAHGMSASMSANWNRAIDQANGQTEVRDDAC
jgi:hypothetical protein